MFLKNIKSFSLVLKRNTELTTGRCTFLHQCKFYSVKECVYGRLWKLSEVMISLSHVARGNGQIQWPWMDASADLTILCLSWGHKANTNTPSWPHKHSHISAGQCLCVCVCGEALQDPRGAPFFDLCSCVFSIFLWPSVQHGAAFYSSPSNRISIKTQLT